MSWKCPDCGCGEYTSIKDLRQVDHYSCNQCGSVQEMRINSYVSNAAYPKLPERATSGLKPPEWYTAYADLVWRATCNKGVADFIRELADEAMRLNAEVEEVRREYEKLRNVHEGYRQTAITLLGTMVEPAAYVDTEMVEVWRGVMRGEAVVVDDPSDGEPMTEEKQAAVRAWFLGVDLAKEPEEPVVQAARNAPVEPSGDEVIEAWRELNRNREDG